MISWETNILDARTPAAVRLVRSSLPDYYEVAASCGIDVDAWIARDLSFVHSELGQYFVLQENDVYVGMICYFPVDELARRQTASLVELMRAQKKGAALLPALRRHSSEIAPVDGDGFYISRVAVAPAARGRGFAVQMLDHLEKIAAAQGKSRLVLHVDSGNEAALRLYQKVGFSPASSTEHCYPVLHKVLPS